MGLQFAYVTGCIATIYGSVVILALLGVKNSAIMYGTGILLAVLLVVLLKKKFSGREEEAKKTIAYFGWIFLFLSVVFLFGPGLIILARQTASAPQTQYKESSDWITVKSPDERLTASLPGPIGFPGEGVNEYDTGWTYRALEQQGNVFYIVTVLKPEIFREVAARENIDLVSSDQNAVHSRLAKLKELVVSGQGMQNVSSGLFTTINGKDAIRFSGTFEKGGISGNMEVVIISIKDSAYYITAGYGDGFTSHLDRILDSLVIK